MRFAPHLAATAALVLFVSVAAAEPVKLTDAELDEIPVTMVEAPIDPSTELVRLRIGQFPTGSWPPHFLREMTNNRKSGGTAPLPPSGN